MRMTSREIKAALVTVGVRHIEIARAAGLSPQLVSEVIAGNRRNEKVETAIARVIGKPIDDVFPVVSFAASA